MPYPIRKRGKGDSLVGSQHLSVSSVYLSKPSPNPLKKVAGGGGYNFWVALSLIRETLGKE